MILTFLDRFQDLGLLILRLGFGAMYLLHGYPKLSGGPAAWEGLGQAMGNFGIHFVPAFWGFMAAFSEFFGAIFLMLGFMFRPACMLMLATMAVAATMHLSRGDTIQTASHAIGNGIVLLSLIFIGPGRFSLDPRPKAPRAKGEA